MSKLRAFDLAAALNGEMPVTKNGKRKAIFVRQFLFRPNQNVLVVFEDGDAAWYCPDGTYYLDRTSNDDLIHPAKNIGLWLNLYFSCNQYVIRYYLSKEEADRCAGYNRIGPAMYVEFPL